MLRRVRCGNRQGCLKRDGTSSLVTWVLQATDSIVDFAVRTGKPFAVVPCCVFPRLFRHRRLPCVATGTIREAGDCGSANQAVEGMRYQLNHGSRNTALHELPKHDRDYASPRHCQARPLSESQRAELPTDKGPTSQDPEQTDAEGEAVITHEQLILYLQHVGGIGACTARVPFDGMNTVVYRLP